MSDDNNNSILSRDSVRHSMEIAKIVIKDVEVDKASASPEELVKLKDKHDYYIDLMRKLTNLLDLYHDIDKIKDEYPNSYSDSMTSHGIEYARLYEELKKISITIKQEYNKRHNIS